MDARCEVKGGSHIAADGSLDGEISHRIQSGWKNWKRTTAVLCDRTISARVKGKVFKSVVRPAMLYGAKTWQIKRAEENKLEVPEMRMLRWMLGVTRRDKVRNSLIRSPYLFNLLMDDSVQNIKEEAPWTMLFADDIVLVDESISYSSLLAIKRKCSSVCI